MAHSPENNDFMNSGNLLLQQNRLDEAETEFRICVEKFPNHVGAKERYAHVAFRKQSYDDAFARYSELKEKHPDNVSGYMGIGNVHLQRNLLDEAEAEFRICVEKFPNHVGAKERYAHVAFRKQSYDDAFARYSVLKEKHPDNVSGYMGIGNVHLQRNLLDEAEAEFRICVEKFPNHVGAKERYAHVAFRKQSYDDAFARYSVLKEKHPDNVSGYMGIGNVHLQRNLLDEAEAEFRICVEKFPNHVGAKERYAHIAFRKQSYDDAFARYSVLKEKHPDNVSGYMGIGNVHLQRNLLDEAEAEFRICVEKFPNHVGAKERYAHVAFRKQDYDDAYAKYSRLKEAYPDNIAGYIGVGNVLLQQNLLDEAEVEFRICVETFPHHAGAKERYAYVALCKQNVDDAYARYTILKEEHPDNMSGYIGVGNVLLQQNLLDEAEAAFRICVETFPDYAGAAKERCAHVALCKLDFNDAYALYSGLKEKYPDKVFGYFGVVNVLFRQNLVDEAEAELRICIEKFPEHVGAKERYAYIALREQNTDEAYARYSVLKEKHPEHVSGYIGELEYFFRNGFYTQFEDAVQVFLNKFKGCFHAYISIIDFHEQNIKRGIHLVLPSFTNLMFELYSDIDEHMKDMYPCFDKNKLKYGALLGARNIYLSETNQISSQFPSPHIALFGDSSLTTSLYYPQRFEERGFHAQFFQASGATIRGIGSDTSVLGLFEKIMNYIRSQRPQYIILKFGQGDVEFGYYFKKFVKQEPIHYDSFFGHLIESYRKKILCFYDLTNVIVHGIDLPSLVERKKCAKRTLDVITDTPNRRKYFDLYQKLIASQPSIVERTQISMEFNARLKEMCKSIGCFYADTKDVFMPNGSSTLHAYFQPNFDHHYLTTDYVKSKAIDVTLSSVMSFLE